MAQMLYIENDGALFRGPARGLPQEVWDGQQFRPYSFEGKSKPVEWGEVISEQEAKEMMAEDGMQPEAAAA